MKKELRINSELQLLTIKEMNEIWGGGDVIDPNQGDTGEIELPKLPNLPTSMPAYIPEIISE